MLILVQGVSGFAVGVGNVGKSDWFWPFCGGGV